MIAVLRGIVKDLRVAIQHRNHRVHPAVIVQIAEGQPAVHARNLEARPRRRAYVLEFDVSHLSHVTHVAEHGIRFLVSPRRELMHVVVYVRAHHKQVLPAIVVQIGDAVPPTGHFVRIHPQTSQGGLLGKMAATLIQEQRKRLLLDGSQPDGRKAIVAHIPEIHAHSRDDIPPLGKGDPRLQGGLLESLPAHIVEELVGHHVVGHEDVGVAVAVIIGNRHTHAASQVRRNARLG